MDEADSMTHAAQAALRRTMEKESRTTRFCLVCNYVSRIIQPITSRCTKFRFKSLSEDKIIERLQFICKEESVSADDDVYKNIVDISGGDMRRAITMLQSVYRLKGGQTVQITAADILEISGVIPNRYLVELLDICKSGNYTNLEKYVEDIINEAFSVGQLFEQLCDFIIQHPDITNKQKSVICDALGKCCYRLEDGGSEYLQIMDLGCTIIKAMQSPA